MSDLTVKVNWGYGTGSGIRLLPDFVPVKVPFKPTFDSQGRLEIGKAINELDQKLQKAWGLPVDLRSQVTESGGIKEFLKQFLIEKLVRQEPDILGDFYLDSSRLGNEPNGLSLPLTMKGAEYKFWLDCTPGPDGRPDSVAIVDALEEAYRHVFLAGAGVEMFTPQQRSDLLEKAPEWAQELMAKAGIGLPRAEVNLESAEWEGSSLRLLVEVETGNQLKSMYALLLPVDQQGAFDFSNIERVAAQIVKDWCHRVGLSEDGRLHAMIVEQIAPDAEEYARWILEVEDQIRADFWAAMNRELDRHLGKADQLLAEAEKWRNEVDDWFGGIGKGKEISTIDCHAYEVKTVELPLPKMPEALKTTYNKIMHGLSTLPGAVSEGLKPKAGDIAKGLEFGFKAAGVVMGEAAKMVLKDVAKAVFWAKVPVFVKGQIGKGLAKRVNGRNAKYILSSIDQSSSCFERILAYNDVVVNVKSLGEKANNISGKIVGIKDSVFGVSQ